MSSGSLMHVSVKRTEEMLYIASHPSEPWLPDWAYNYPKSSIEEYAQVHASVTVQAQSSGGSYSPTEKRESKPVEDPTIQLVAGMSDFSIKLMASKVKVPKQSE